MINKNDILDDKIKFFINVIDKTTSKKVFHLR